MINCGDVVKEVHVSYGNITTTGWKSQSSEIHNCSLSLKILQYHAQTSGACFRKRETNKQTNKTLSIQKVKSVPLRKPAAVHCQVVTPTVLKPVCMILCRNHHCLDRTHARTHSHLQWERLAIGRLKISAHGRSWTQTDIHSHTNVSFLWSRFCLPQWP